MSSHRPQKPHGLPTPPPVSFTSFFPILVDTFCVFESTGTTAQQHHGSPLPLAFTPFPFVSRARCLRARSPLPHQASSIDNQTFLQQLRR